MTKQETLECMDQLCDAIDFYREGSLFGHEHDTMMEIFSRKCLIDYVVEIRNVYNIDVHTDVKYKRICDAIKC